MNLEANLMNAPITTTPAGDLLANIHELEWLDVGGGTPVSYTHLTLPTIYSV